MSTLRSRNRPSTGWTGTLEGAIIQTAEVEITVHADFHCPNLCVLIWGTKTSEGFDNPRGIVGDQECVTVTGWDVGVCSENEAAKGDPCNVNIAC